MAKATTSGPVEHEEAFGPREDWSRLWSEGVQERKKVLKPADTTWEQTQLGRLRVISSPARTDVRTHRVDVFELEIPAGGRSGLRRHMADEVLYVPQNAVAQHFAADGASLRLISARNRLFKLLGYDRDLYLEDAPEHGDRVGTATVSR